MIKEFAGNADTSEEMNEDDLEEAAANLAILIRAELEVSHLLGEHRVPVPECDRCAPAMASRQA